MLRKLALGVLCTLLLISEGFGQNSSSAYSALGIGEFNYGGQVQNQGMGGLGISFGTGWVPMLSTLLFLREIPFLIFKLPSTTNE